VSAAVDVFAQHALPVWEQRMNDEQLAAIRHDSGPLRLLAVAGAGKTRAIVHRAVRLVEHCGVNPERILMVTFSRKAADEMDARMRHLGLGSVSCQTWHAFCLRVLKEDATRYATWTIDDKDRAKFHTKKAMGHEGENWIGGDFTKVRRFIGHCKANLWDADSSAARAHAEKVFGHQAGRAIRVFAISQDAIENNGLLTFDDMLVYVYRHFQQSEPARLAWAGRFDHVMSDEDQDSNGAQIALAEQMARDHRNYVAVGDLAQGIYSFRGSDVRYLAEFPERWGSPTIEMVRNYRSGSSIIDLANSIIRPGKHRLERDMIAERDGGTFEGKVEVVACDVLEDEGRELVDFVNRHKDGGGSYADVCCLFRLNAQSRAIEEALLKARVPYVLIGGTNFYERKEVKDLLAYLRVAMNKDHDGDGVRRCINAPFRFLGAKFVERVMAEWDGGYDWDECVDRAAETTGIQSRQKASAKEWLAILDQVREKACGTVDEEGKPADVLDFLIRKTGYLAWLEKEEGEESIESSHAANVRELVRVAANFGTVEELLDYVDENVRQSAKQRRKAPRDAVTLMSIHRSKGLEWPVVWVVGVNDQILPHARGDEEEERRLLYVAVTRARDHLVLSHVREMATRMGLKTVERSRFLDGITIGTRVPKGQQPLGTWTSGTPLSEGAVELIQEAIDNGIPCFVTTTDEVAQ